MEERVFVVDLLAVDDMVQAHMGTPHMHGENEKEKQRWLHLLLFAPYINRTNMTLSASLFGRLRFFSVLFPCQLVSFVDLLILPLTMQEKSDDLAYHITKSIWNIHILSLFSRFRSVLLIAAGQQGVDARKGSAGFRVDEWMWNCNAKGME